MSDNRNPSGAPTLVGLLGLLFLGLKLGHVIDWSWWLVTLPFWGGAALIGAIIALTLISAASAAGVKGAKRRRVKLTLNEDEVRALYALAQHDAQGSFGCPLEHTPDGIAGTHEEHGLAVSTALAKLADAVLAVQENNTKEQ